MLFLYEGSTLNEKRLLSKDLQFLISGKKSKFSVITKYIFLLKSLIYERKGHRI